MKYRLEIALLMGLAGCGHTPKETAKAAPAALPKPVSIDGGYLFSGVPDPNSHLFLRIDGMRASFRRASAVSTEQADEEAPILGTYPFFKVGNKDDQSIRVLFTSPDGGFAWMPGQAAGHFSREVPLPSAMAGTWSMLSPRRPEKVFGQVTLGPDFLMESERAGEGKRMHALYLRGSDGVVSLFSFDHPDQPVQLFLVDGALVAKIERKDALLGYRPEKMPAWLDRGSTVPFVGRDGVFHPLQSPGVRLHIHGTNFKATDADGTAGKVTFIRIVARGPLSSYQPGDNEPQADVIWSSPMSFVWMDQGGFTLIAREEAVPNDLRGEWNIVPLADFSVGAKVRFTDGGASLSTGEENQELRWLEGGHLAGEKGLYHVHQVKDAWVMTTPKGWPSVLYRDKPPAFALGRDGFAKQLDQVCAAFAMGEPIDFPLRLVRAIAQVAEREPVADPLLAVLTLFAQVDPTVLETLAKQSLGSMGLTLPAGCLSQTKKE